MSIADPSQPSSPASAVLAPQDHLGPTRPIHLVSDAQAIEQAPGLSVKQRQFCTSSGFWGQAGRLSLAPDELGNLGAVLIGTGGLKTCEPGLPMELALGIAGASLPSGDYRLATQVADPRLAAIAFGLGAYRFAGYKSIEAKIKPRLVVPQGIDPADVGSVVDAVWHGRDLINTPANDMGPGEIEAAARALGAGYGADVTSIVGDDLLPANFPLIHAVGRASPRAPRLIDLKWAPKSVSATAKTLTLVGKGIAFDTGGLDIKPSSNMLLMKKDMGGAAAVLALAHMIMASGLDVRLRVLIASAENSIAGNAFRPGDIIKSRRGLTVEIGNTDAEGRLVLADALTLADEDAPDLLITMATLTGAARVALGPDLPALFTQDDALATRLVAMGLSCGDPVWRMPLWPGYERMLDSEVADMGNVAEGPFGGAVIAALFLQRFVTKAKSYAHFDIYGWRPSQRALGPKGGEVSASRALFETVRTMAGKP